MGTRVLALIFSLLIAAGCSDTGTGEGDALGPDDTFAQDTTTGLDTGATDTFVEPDGGEIIPDGETPPDTAEDIAALPDTTIDVDETDGIEPVDAVEDITEEDIVPEPDVTPPADGGNTTDPPPVGTEDWYTVFGGTWHEQVKGVTADSNGNVYIAGTFSENLMIGTAFLEPTEPGSAIPDTYVASFSPEGDFRWAHAIGAGQSDVPFEISVDGQDNIYVLGAHKEDIQVGDFTLVASGSTDLFLVSYNADGDLLWAKSWGGEFGETPRDMSVNDAGDIFITGSFTGTIVADNISATTPIALGGLSEIFVLGVDGLTHEAMWIRIFTGAGHDVGTALVADGDRNVVVAVSFIQDLTVDPEAGIVFSSGATNFDAGIVRFDNDGNILWAQEFGGPGGEEIIGLDLDADGNIYATGVFSDTASFGGADLVGLEGHDVVLAAYDQDGVHLFSHGFTGSSTDQALDLEVHGDGIYICGRFKNDLTFDTITLNSSPDNYDVFVARFDKADGKPTWAHAVGSPGSDQANGIGVGGDGGIFVGGHMEGEVSFGDVIHPPSGAGIDGFVFRMTE